MTAAKSAGCMYLYMSAARPHGMRYLVLELAASHIKTDQVCAVDKVSFLDGLVCDIVLQVIAPHRSILES